MNDPIRIRVPKQPSRTQDFLTDLFEGSVAVEADINEAGVHFGSVLVIDRDVLEDYAKAATIVAVGFAVTLNLLADGRSDKEALDTSSEVVKIGLVANMSSAMLSTLAAEIQAKRQQ